MNIALVNPPMSLRQRYGRFAFAGGVLPPQALCSLAAVLRAAGHRVSITDGALSPGGIPEVVDDGKTGVLTPFGNESAFTAAIKRFITDPSLCRDMGRSGAAYIRQKHDLDRNYRRVETVLFRHQRFQRK